MNRQVAWIRRGRVGGWACAMLSLLMAWSMGATAAAETTAAQVTATVTKVSVLRYRLAFSQNSANFLKPADEYQRFLDSLKAREKDVVAVYYIYSPGFALGAAFGSDPRIVRQDRLQVAYRPMQAWLTELGMDPSIVDVDSSKANFMAGPDFDSLTVEVLVKRR